MIKLDKQAVARRLVEEIQKKYGTQVAIAKELGLKDSTGLTAYVKGKSLPGNVMQQKLRQAGIDVEYVMYGNEESETDEVRMEACKARMKLLQAKIQEISIEMGEISEMMNNLEKKAGSSSDTPQ